MPREPRASAERSDRGASALPDGRGCVTPREQASVPTRRHLTRSMTGATVNCDRGWTAFKMPEVIARATAGGAS